ncbi:MAG: DUF177 domain-containing protein [Thermodesulfobacteriota bacterium]
MKILIDDIPEEGLELDLTGDRAVLSQALESMPNLGELRLAPIVTGRVNLVKSGGEVLLTADVRVSASLECARCLTRFESPIHTDISLVLKPIAADNPSESDLVESDANYVFFHGPEIDVGKIILQELLLEVPMKPLCNPECPGLCARCGAPKGSDQCTCNSSDTIDPRWKALADLKDKVRK